MVPVGNKAKRRSTIPQKQNLFSLFQQSLNRFKALSKIIFALIKTNTQPDQEFERSSYSQLLSNLLLEHLDKFQEYNSLVWKKVESQFILEKEFCR